MILFIMRTHIILRFRIKLSCATFCITPTLAISFFDGFLRHRDDWGLQPNYVEIKKEIESLGYQIDNKGIIYDGNEPYSYFGSRKSVINDLSPAATFIAYNYNSPVDKKVFEKEAKRLIREVEQECGWMYETWHPHCNDPNRVKGKINYTVWSDVFLCPKLWV